MKVRVDRDVVDARARDVERHSRYAGLESRLQPCCGGQGELDGLTGDSDKVGGGGSEQGRRGPGSNSRPISPLPHFLQLPGKTSFARAASEETHANSASPSPSIPEASIPEAEAFTFPKPPAPMASTPGAPASPAHATLATPDRSAFDGHVAAMQALMSGMDFGGDEDETEPIAEKRETEDPLSALPDAEELSDLPTPFEVDARMAATRAREPRAPPSPPPVHPRWATEAAAEASGSLAPPSRQSPLAAVGLGGCVSASAASHSGRTWGQWAWEVATAPACLLSPCVSRAAATISKAAKAKVPSPSRPAAAPVALRAPSPFADELASKPPSTPDPNTPGRTLFGVTLTPAVWPAMQASPALSTAKYNRLR